jgi:branched-subunit amino acid transport protein
MWAFLCAQSTFETSMIWRVSVMSIRSAWALSWWNYLFARVMNIVTWLNHSRMLNSNSNIHLPGIFCRLIRCVPSEIISSLWIYLKVASRALWGMCINIWMIILLVYNLNKRRYIIDFDDFFLNFGLHFYELNNNYNVIFKINSKIQM